MNNNTTTQPVPVYVTTNGTWHEDIISLNVNGVDHVYN